MACDCISKITKLVKQKTNETGCVDTSISCPDGNLRVNVYGLYHKQKKDGTFQDKWQQINIMPEYCPFCGKKYENTIVHIPSEKGGSLMDAVNSMSKAKK